jgi:hypothetical protein
VSRVIVQAEEHVNQVPIFLGFGALVDVLVDDLLVERIELTEVPVQPGAELQGMPGLQFWQASLCIFVFLKKRKKTPTLT